MWMEPIACSTVLYSAWGYVSVREYKCRCTICDLIYAWVQECVTSWFYSILRGTSGEDSRQQGSSYYHLFSRWGAGRGIALGFTFLSTHVKKSNIIKTQNTIATLASLETEWLMTFFVLLWMKREIGVQQMWIRVLCCIPSWNRHLPPGILYPPWCLEMTSLKQQWIPDWTKTHHTLAQKTYLLSQ